ncbi:hypothetical protein [Metabacillus halosaccharovorans]|uniref:hypothetical protein n=1 Tax=Metabacillus halosaccharovorans TaxID=930124 RepID=UPI001C1F7728|nr:hypothetical protein [Metabacillus halosaccharovorans]
MPIMKICDCCGRLLPAKDRCECKREADRARNREKNRRYRVRKKLLKSAEKNKEHEYDL